MVSLELERAEAILLQEALNEYLNGFEFDKEKLAFHATSKMLLRDILMRLGEEIGEK